MPKMIPPSYAGLVYNRHRIRSGEVDILDRDVPDLLAHGWELGSNLEPSDLGPEFLDLAEDITTDDEEI